VPPRACRECVDFAGQRIAALTLVTRCFKQTVLAAELRTTSHCLVARQVPCPSMLHSDGQLAEMSPLSI
jgi:hypothetical protein